MVATPGDNEKKRSWWTSIGSRRSSSMCFSGVLFSHPGRHARTATMDWPSQGLGPDPHKGSDCTIAALEASETGT
jgi:hypothetical protein